MTEGKAACVRPSGALKSGRKVLDPPPPPLLIHPSK